MTRLTAGGLEWSVRDWGGDGDPLLLLHGFTGCADSWDPIARSFGSYRCLAPDLPGHGRTDAPLPADRWTMDRLAMTLCDLMDGLGIEKASIIGYSMGARIALSLACHAPRRVEKLVLIGGTPGLRREVDQQQRRADDEMLARVIEEQGVEAFVRHWELSPIFATQSAEQRDRQRVHRLAQSAEGLAASLRAFGTGSQRPLFDELPSLELPVLLVVGEHDAKFRSIAEEMLAALPDARLELIPGAGHNAPLENPETFIRVTDAFLGKETPCRLRP